MAIDGREFKEIISMVQLEGFLEGMEDFVCLIKRSLMDQNKHLEGVRSILLLIF